MGLGHFLLEIGKCPPNSHLNPAIDAGMLNHVGKYGIGRRNPNGEALLDFVLDNDLFVCNTAFQHSSRHLTTRKGSIRDWSKPNTNKSRPYYSQID